MSSVTSKAALECTVYALLIYAAIRRLLHFALFLERIYLQSLKYLKVLSVAASYVIIFRFPPTWLVPEVALRPFRHSP